MDEHRENRLIGSVDLAENVDVVCLEPTMGDPEAPGQFVPDSIKLNHDNDVLCGTNTSAK